MTLFSSLQPVSSSIFQFVNFVYIVIVYIFVKVNKVTTKTRNKPPVLSDPT